MGVVDLDGGVVGEVVQVAAPRDALIQDQARGVGHHEVLLVHAQQAPLLGAVVGVQEQGEAAGDIPCVEADAGLDQPLVRGVHVEEAQPAALALVAGDVDLVQGGAGGEIAEGDVIVNVCAAHPALLAPFEPMVRGLGLLAVHKALAEQPTVVGEPQAVRGQAQRGEAVQEAGRQPPQAAVAQGGLQLELLQFGQGDALRRQFIPDLPVQAQVDQVVAQQLADQELGGDVVDLLPTLVVSPRLRGVGDIPQQGVEQLEPGAVRELPVFCVISQLHGRALHGLVSMTLAL